MLPLRSIATPMQEHDCLADRPDVSGVPEVSVLCCVVGMECVWVVGMEWGVQRFVGLRLLA